MHQQSPAPQLGRNNCPHKNAVALVGRLKWRTLYYRPRNQLGLVQVSFALASRSGGL